MLISDILEFLKNYKKGTYTTLCISKDLGNEVKKITTVVVRLGIDYSHMSNNVGKVIGRLPWGEWVDGHEHFIITYKGELYLRFYSSFTKSIKVEYLYNGHCISKEQAEQITGKAERVNTSNVFNVNFRNIIALG